LYKNLQELTNLIADNESEINEIKNKNYQQRMSTNDDLKLIELEKNAKDYRIEYYEAEKEAREVIGSIMKLPSTLPVLSSIKIENTPKVVLDKYGKVEYINDFNVIVQGVVDLGINDFTIPKTLAEEFKQNIFSRLKDLRDEPGNVYNEVVYSLKEAYNNFNKDPNQTSRYNNLKEICDILLSIKVISKSEMNNYLYYYNTLHEN